MVGASRLLCGWLQFLDAGYAAAASSLWPARVGWHALSPRRAWLNCESRCPARSSQVGHAPHDRIRVGWHALSLRRAWLYCESRRPARPSLHNAPTPIAALWACHTMSCYRPNCRRTFDRIVTVGIRGEFWLFGRTVENSGEAGVDGAELTARRVGAASKSRSPREESDRRRVGCCGPNGPAKFSS